MGWGTPHVPEVTVALQGTLDTFALADVLRLLASTKKQGRLRVTGERGSGSIWVDGGNVVGSELSVPGSAEESAAHTLFTLLRFATGSFTFEAGATAPRPAAAVEVEPLLAEAEELLAEWHAIEEVVPSLDAWLVLRPELHGDVVVDGARWRVIAAVAGGTTAGAVGTALELGELDALRAIKELIELGLVEVSEDAPPAVAARPTAPWSRDAHGGPELDPAPPSFTEMQSGLGAVTLSHEPSPEPSTPDPVAPAADTRDDAGRRDAVSDLAPPPPVPSPTTAVAGEDRAFDAPAYDEPAFDTAPPATTVAAGDEPTLDDAAEIARQLANLSPRAAKAVAAAAKATTEEEREAALAAIEAEDENVNRGLLLRFLGSVDS
jgi:hypothetical protein